MTPQRIKEAAEAKYPIQMSHTITDGPREAYIAGATAEHERAQGLVDALEQIKNLATISNLPDGSVRGAEVLRIAKAAISKWKGEGEQ